MSYEEAITRIMRAHPNLDSDQVRAMFDDELRAQYVDGKRYKRALEETQRLILLWLREAELSQDMVRFVVSHRRAYVWAALVREQMKPPEDGTKGDTSPATEAYRSKAREMYQVEGECEIDDAAEVSISDSGGAYVQAWVWVSDEDLSGE